MRKAPGKVLEQCDHAWIRENNFRDFTRTTKRDYYTDKQGMGQNDVLSFKIRRKAHGLYEQENRIECDVM
uniref:Uncharacterized protein n=1 Tax=Pristionchus pacificus TaxID=54126 RepID=A0A2A6BNE9_PRIPA|eukprot:PDM67336.1 hypothetical protein PRIPAC_48753 [Pristionchus pacificus]